MTVDNIIYLNVKRMLEEYGFSERICIDACELSPTFFSNYRNGKSRRFKVADVEKLARFFDVTMDYICDFKNTRDEFFIKRYKLPARDEKCLMAAFKKLDPVGRIVVADAINNELKNSVKRQRERNRNI